MRFRAAYTLGPIPFAACFVRFKGTRVPRERAAESDCHADATLVSAYRRRKSGCSGSCHKPPVWIFASLVRP